jgi:hypothetical protein
MKEQIVPPDESSSESCLHCEINDLVQEYIEEQERVDIVELVAKVAESLVELVLLAPEEAQAKLLRSWKRAGRLNVTRIRCNDAQVGQDGCAIHEQSRQGRRR